MAGGFSGKLKQILIDTLLKKRRRSWQPIIFPPIFLLWRRASSLYGNCIFILTSGWANVFVPNTFIATAEPEQSEQKKYQWVYQLSAGLARWCQRSRCSYCAWHAFNILFLQLLVLRSASDKEIRKRKVLTQWGDGSSWFQKTAYRCDCTCRKLLRSPNNRENARHSMQQGRRDKPLNGFVIFIVGLLIMDESLPWLEIRLNLESTLAYFLLSAPYLSKCVKTLGQWDFTDVCQHYHQAFWNVLAH